MIHRMAGVKLINAVSNEPGGSQVGHMQVDTAKETIIKISQGLKILSKHTSFIGVHVKQTANGPVATPLVKQIPLQQPRYESMDKCMMFSSSAFVSCASSYNVRSLKSMSIDSLECCNESMLMLNVKVNKIKITQGLMMMVIYVKKTSGRTNVIFQKA